MASLLVAGAALAQSDDKPSARELAIEEITVTARKREESLREVPVAVTAMTAQMIAEAGIRDVQDLALLSPGLSYREGFGRATGDANNRPSIRGMSSILGNPNAAFFVDGVYVDGPITAYSLDNLERVEVIRGPQAATFGRGTFAGAVNFITRRPGEELQGRISVEGGDHSYSEVNGFVSGPLIDGRLGAELNFRSYNIGGDPEYPNLAPNGAEIGAESTASLGVKLNWTPSDSTSVYLNLNWSDDSDGAFAYGNWNGGDNDADNINVNSPNTSNCFGPDFTVFSTFFTTNRSRGYYCGEIGTPQAYWQDSGGLKGVERNTFTANMIADFNLGDTTLTSVTGYTNYDYENAFAAIYDGASVSWGGRDDNRVFSQEIRLTSSQDQPLRFVAGAYYYRQSNGDGFSAGFNPQTTSPREVDLDAVSFTDDSEIENSAVFAGVDLDIGDALTLSAEARYQEEEIRLSGANAVGEEQYDGSPSIDFDAFLPRVALTWRATDSLNVYAITTTPRSSRPSATYSSARAAPTKSPKSRPTNWASRACSWTGAWQSTLRFSATNGTSRR